ncbi:histidine phosphatase family protein [Ramlibacter sp. H39-3-26]|uniref:histidine phosphatase family protein n=1 Tax=Curvibacter soli TaxID=3031331 RepID=UPI0023DA9562|nr:histidine phosphatase family protein [Ramlibacter sp. H39-3-26]MDF1484527.1 histidine phosphatase family protein [Ramlibacter sp. H39-3-26]
MEEPTRIIAIRHGETAWNVDTRIQGHLDIPLNDTGRRQAGQLAAALGEEPVSAIYASDLSRAWETAQAVGRTTGAPVHAAPALRERGFGIFEGKTFAEVETALPAQALRWRRRDPDFEPEGGESLRRFRTRVTQAAHGLAARHPGQLIALVAHGGVLDVLYRDATGLDLQAPRTWALGNAAINRLLWTPSGLMLVGWADTQHLRSSGALDETTT